MKHIIPGLIFENDPHVIIENPDFAELDRLYGEPITFETSFADESFFTKLYEMIFSYLED